MATKTWDLTDFSRVQTGSTFHVKISKGKAFKVVTTTDDNVLPFVEVEKDGKSLKIGLKRDQSYKFEKSPEAEVVLPALEGVDLSGAASGHLEGFDSEKNVVVQLSGASKLDGALQLGESEARNERRQLVDLDGRSARGRGSGQRREPHALGEFPLKQGKLDLSGASTADIVVRSTAPFTATMSGASKVRGKLETTELTLKSEGASHVNLDGSAKRAKVSVSGASHLQLDGVKTETMNITLSGASHAVVAVSESLDYDVSSVSHLTYTGNPAHVEGKRTGGSHVTHE